MINNYNIAIFASGAGSNAKNIINHFKQNKTANIALVLSNRANAGVLDIAKQNGIKTNIFLKEELFDGNVLAVLKENKIDLIILAGFLLKVPEDLVKNFPNKIINIHPALLPKYGGKGMYGKFVHESVFENKEKETGITIHYVNEHYDEGNIIEQFSCDLLEQDTPDVIEQKVRSLEQKYFAITIQKLLENEL